MLQMLDARIDGGGRHVVQGVFPAPVFGRLARVDQVRQGGYVQCNRLFSFVKRFDSAIREE
jgi:hypothetical protein